MPRLLGSEPPTRVLKATTFTKFAERVLALSAVAARVTPELQHPATRDILLTLFLAENEARYLSPEQIALSECPSHMAKVRWIEFLIQSDLVEKRHDLIGLTESGYERVIDFLEALYAAQRQLD